jgi:hypothetical protein
MLNPSVYLDGIQAPLVVTPKLITGTTYTLQSGDDWLIVDQDDDIQIIVPVDPSEGFLPFLPSGPVVNITTNGTGAVGFVGADGVTLNAFDGGNSLAGQFAVASVVKESSNLWKLTGLIAAGDAPAITSDGGGATADVAVSAPDTAVTTVVATGLATVVYSLAGGDDVALFAINASSGVLTFKVASVVGAYEVIVRASNVLGRDDQTITVTVS